MKKSEIYKKAVKLWGVEFEIDMMIEECAELIQALQKYKRDTSFKTINNMYEELADVEIMSEQMRIVFNSDSIDLEKERKIRRLETRIKG
jgi:NTP pyrophosphatase (non-canonical NTP hydrolase)